MQRLATLAALALFSLAPACQVVHEAAPVREFETENVILIAGQRFPTEAPVLLPDDPAGYDATSTELHFEPVPGREPPVGPRYQPGRVQKLPDGRRVVRFDPASLDVDALREVVDQVVLHYDACGTSRQCFRILHDVRGLSAHFLVDLDGTVYQTLDLADQAWHATKANWRSIGIEIANVGAFPPGAEETPLDEWYVTDHFGARVQIPGRLGETGLRTRSFEARPVRPGRIQGEVQGVSYEQYDFTPEQYRSLVDLTATLCRAFPLIVPDAPRDPGGAVRMDVLSDEEYEQFRGILGHYHVSAYKNDPGPAFTWEPFLALVKSHSMRAARVAQ